MLNITPNADGRRRVATSQLWELLGIIVDRRDRHGALRISEIMQRLGFKRTTVRINGESAQAGYMTEHEELLALSTDEREPGEDDVASIVDTIVIHKKEEAPF
jgi:hypothetical protein